VASKTSSWPRAIPPPPRPATPSPATLAHPPPFFLTMGKFFSTNSAFFTSLATELRGGLHSAGATLVRRWSALPPSRRRRLRWLLLPLVLGALAGAPLAALALLPLALPLSLLGAALLPPPQGYPLSAGLGAWAQTLASGGDGHLPLLL
jgi:hypothetical protein